MGERPCVAWLWLWNSSGSDSNRREWLWGIRGRIEVHDWLRVVITNDSACRGDKELRLETQQAIVIGNGNAPGLDRETSPRALP